MSYLCFAWSIFIGNNCVQTNIKMPNVIGKVKYVHVWLHYIPAYIIELYVTTSWGTRRCKGKQRKLCNLRPPRPFIISICEIPSPFALLPPLPFAPFPISPFPLAPPCLPFPWPPPHLPFPISSQSNPPCLPLPAYPSVLPSPLLALANPSTPPRFPLPVCPSPLPISPSPSPPLPPFCPPYTIVIPRTQRQLIGPNCQFLRSMK